MNSCQKLDETRLLQLNLQLDSVSQRNQSELESMVKDDVDTAQLQLNIRRCKLEIEQQTAETQTWLDVLAVERDQAHVVDKRACAVE